MSEGAIKGTAIQTIVDMGRELVESGRVTREALEARLEAEDLRLLDEKIEPSLWYPIASAGRVDAFVIDALGRDVAEMMRDVGASSARKVFEQPSSRGFIEGAQKHGERMGNVLAGLPRLLMNFGEWRFEGDIDDRFCVIAADVDALPETTRYATEGFVQVLSEIISQRTVCVTSRRPTPGELIIEVETG